MGRVHPRVGGETARVVNSPRIAHGPSPRGRGNRRLLAGRRLTKAGPSPRGRGNPSPPSPLIDGLIRSIPAWAGKPPPRRGSGRWSPGVHPRVGGETGEPDEAVDHRRGSIPAWAGKPASGDIGGRRDGSIPAWAGKPRSDGHRRHDRLRSIPAWAGKPHVHHRAGKPRC